MMVSVRWAERAQYTILTRDVPAKFTPYNAVVRISQVETKDTQRDYLAHLVYQQDDA